MATDQPDMRVQQFFMNVLLRYKPLSALELRTRDGAAA